MTRFGFGPEEREKNLITDNLALDNKKYNIKKINKKAAIFFNIRNAYNKINRNKTFKQQENRGIQRRMMKFIREMISER